MGDVLVEVAARRRGAPAAVAAVGAPAVVGRGGLLLVLLARADVHLVDPELAVAVAGEDRIRPERLHEAGQRGAVGAVGAAVEPEAVDAVAVAPAHLAQEFAERGEVAGQVARALGHHRRVDDVPFAVAHREVELGLEAARVRRVEERADVVLARLVVVGRVARREEHAHRLARVQRGEDDVARAGAHGGVAEVGGDDLRVGRGGVERLRGRVEERRARLAGALADGAAAAGEEAVVVEEAEAGRGPPFHEALAAREPDRVAGHFVSGSGRSAQARRR